MKNSTTTLSVLVLLGALLLSACGPQSSSAPATDADLCQAVFASLQQADPASFTGMFLTADAITTIADGLETATDKQRGIKEELLSFDAAEIAADATAAFDKIRAQAEQDGLDLAAGSYQGLVDTKVRFDVPGLSCRTLKFEVGFEARNYVVCVDMLQSPQGFHLFDTKLKAYDTVAVSYVSPEGDTAEATAGADFEYEVTFDTEAANSQGAWIEIVFDGKPAGMVAGTTLESPMLRRIPGQVVTQGNHTLAVRVQPSGQATGYPLGEAVLTLTVK